MGLIWGEGGKEREVAYLNNTQVHQDLRHPRFLGTKFKSLYVIYYQADVRYLLGSSYLEGFLANPYKSYTGSFNEL